MEARLEERGDVIFVHLSGHITFEAADLFRKRCFEYLEGNKVVFNLESLDFIGSSGIEPFVNAISKLSLQQASRVKLCSLSTEFKRVFESKTLSAGFYEDTEQAYVSFFKGAAENYQFID